MVGVVSPTSLLFVCAVLSPPPHAQPSAPPDCPEVFAAAVGGVCDFHAHNGPDVYESYHANQPRDKTALASAADVYNFRVSKNTSVSLAGLCFRIGCPGQVVGEIDFIHEIGVFDVNDEMS
uniref:Sod_Cu domain-containing protein n=1 Tax=Panagrellus redivivus TaxID=6233 RepID=A0A7E4UND0_PANRE